MGPKGAPRGHLEVAATVKNWVQNSPENYPNLSIGTPGARKLQISSHTKIIQKSNFYKSHIFCFQECQWRSKGRFRGPKMIRKFHQNAPRWLGADLRIAQKQAGCSFSPLRTTWKMIICALESWDCARQHSEDTEAYNKSNAVQILKMNVVRRRQLKPNPNLISSNLTKVQSLVWLQNQCRRILPTQHQIFHCGSPSHAQRSSTSCPQGFN